MVWGTTHITSWDPQVVFSGVWYVISDYLYIKCMHSNGGLKSNYIVNGQFNSKSEF